MKRVHLIHGFNQEHENQAPTIAMLKPLIEREDCQVMVHDYGELNLLETTANDNIARLIYPSVRPGDTLVGFSNGAAIIAHLQDLGVAAKKIVLIQPALNNKWVPNENVDQICVFYNSRDIATVAGKWYSRLVNLLPWNWGKGRHHWGEMGNTGYVGNDPRYAQFDTSLYKVNGHSGWTSPEAADLRELMVDCV